VLLSSKSSSNYRKATVVSLHGKLLGCGMMACVCWSWFERAWRGGMKETGSTQHNKQYAAQSVRGRTQHDQRLIIRDLSHIVQHEYA